MNGEQAAENASAIAIIRQNRKIRATENAIENVISPAVASIRLNLAAARTVLSKAEAEPLKLETTKELIGIKLPLALYQRDTIAAEITHQHVISKPTDRPTDPTRPDPMSY
jgi:hypothetical protein